MTSYTHVAVGVIRKRGQVLLAKRRDDAHQGGLWEFPGGKVEPGESVQHCLQRELKEELNIDIRRSEALIQVRHHYSDKSVLLDVWEVTEFSGEARGNEGQPIAWVKQGELLPGSDCAYPLPEANAAIIKALQLPDTYLITGDFQSSADFFDKLERALRRGLQIVQLRSPGSLRQLAPDNQLELMKGAAALCIRYGARMVVNAMVDAQSTLVGEGTHLPAASLMSCGRRPDGFVGASCHNQAELQKAADLDLDYVLLSPVMVTKSHLEAEPIGWERFSDLTASVNIPVYALGGLDGESVAKARQLGGQGVAGISAFWD